MVISSRNPVHSVLFLILAFFNAAGLFILLNAEFLAMLLVVVYVGAVAVLFLFVVMMLDINFSELREGFQKYRPLGLVIGSILIAELIATFFEYSKKVAISSAIRILPITSPRGRYFWKPSRSSEKLISSIITTNKNRTATAPT